jgi:DNA-binding MarR family transcriptional regulator
VTVDHDQLADWLARERDLAARGVKRGHNTAGQTPVTRAAKLLPVDWRVLERLAGYGPRGIWPGVPELAARLGVSDRTVQRSLRRLEATGKVEAVPTFAHPDDQNWTARGRRIRYLGEQVSNTYRLADPGDAAGTSSRAVTPPGDTTIDRIPHETPAQTPVTRPKSDKPRVTPGTRVSSSSGEWRYQRRPARTRSDPRRLTAAQRRTARELPWYREWLLAHGRTPEEVDGARRPRAPPGG